MSKFLVQNNVFFSVVFCSGAFQFENYVNYSIEQLSGSMLVLKREFFFNGGKKNY